MANLYAWQDKGYILKECKEITKLLTTNALPEELEKYCKCRDDFYCDIHRLIDDYNNLTDRVKKWNKINAKWSGWKKMRHTLKKVFK